MWEARADRMLFPGICHSLRGDFSWPKMGILKRPLTLAQIIPFQDSDLEKLYTYIRFLLTKLPKLDYGPEYDFSDDVDMRYYRLEKIQEGSIALEPRGDGEVSGPTAVGTGQVRQEEAPLSELIRVLNERFGTEWTEGERLFLEAVREDAVQEPVIQEAARVNTFENFGYRMDKLIDGLFINRLDKSTGMAAKCLDNPEIRDLVRQALYRDIYDSIHAQ
jgi:type I restriction enzyme R subunit